MAEEELNSTTPDPTTADGHKRKLESLERNDEHADSEANLNPDSVDSATPFEENNGGTVESEPKRPRLEESNGDAIDDGLVSHDGQNEEEKIDEIEGKESKHPEDDIGHSVDGQVPVQLETTTEEAASDVSENLEIGSAEELRTKNLEGEEPSKEHPREEPASDVDENPEIGSAEELGTKNSEGEEPSKEHPREGDVPVASAEQHTGSDTQILTRKMEVPNDKVGVLIGKGGDTIRALQDSSGAKVQIMKDADADLRSATRPLEVVGTLHSINKAEKLIKDVIEEAHAGGCPSLVARGFNIVQETTGAEQLEIHVPIEKVGFVIGKGGETIRNLQKSSGARIQVLQQNLSDGDQLKEKTVRVTGNKMQIETAREMINDVMNQTMKPPPLSGGYNQQSLYPREHVALPWGPRRPHQAQFSGYDYPQRGPNPSQISKYPRPPYGNYPPQHGPRSNFGPSWEQRPPPSMHGPSPQSSYNYGRQQGPNQPPLYSRTPAQPYVGGYNEVKYDHYAPQRFGQMGSQPTTPAQGVPHSGYGPLDQFRPPMYGMQPQVSHSQSYPQAKPGEVPYQAPVSSYGQNVAPQQSYPYTSPGSMQQSYPHYGSAPASGGYSHAPAPAPAPAPASSYPPQGGQPVAAYGQPGVQQPSAYAQAGQTGGYGSYSTAQTGYTEQQAANSAAYGYQVPADPATGAAQGPTAAYPAAAAVQSGYLQTGQPQPSYDQPAGYGNVPAQTGYGNSVPSQPVYPQYDTSQIYGSQA